MREAIAFKKKSVKKRNIVANNIDQHPILANDKDVYGHLSSVMNPMERWGLGSPIQFILDPHPPVHFQFPTLHTGGLRDPPPLVPNQMEDSPKIDLQNGQKWPKMARFFKKKIGTSGRYSPSLCSWVHPNLHSLRAAANCLCFGEVVPLDSVFSCLPICVHVSSLRKLIPERADENLWWCHPFSCSRSLSCQLTGLHGITAGIFVPWSLSQRPQSKNPGNGQIHSNWNFRNLQFARFHCNISPFHALRVVPGLEK